ncbi:MAG TPA: methylmalonyl-CoA mutase family protein [Hyphomicrobiaceae bacterium]|nr:methylmalonyl-CoA mutase family protein [Hyphomicrobiaceae bacterium]
MSDPSEPLASEFQAPTREAWLELVAKVLKRARFEDRLVSHLPGGLDVQPLYTRADEIAGTAPVLRAAPGGWDIRQRHAEPDARKVNAAIREDIAGGVTSLLLQITAPGQFGLGYSAEALATALAGVPLESVAVALDARENTLDAAGSLIEIWHDAGISEAARRGAFNLDPLGTLAATGTLYYPAEHACRIAARFVRDGMSMPSVRILLADGRPYHEAGASEAQELAALLATLVAYLRACEAEGVAPDAAAPKIALALAADADLFLTMAKLRAARRLAAHVLEACGAGGAAPHIHITASTSRRMLARRDPWVNMLRATAACAGAAFGGADAITVLPFTDAIGRPDAFARRVARNTHHVLQAESTLGRVGDPAYGSWFVEKLTADLAAQAWSAFQEIESRGGLARALETGFVQAQIAEVARVRSRAIDTLQLEMTGVSAFPLLADDGVKVSPHPPSEPIVVAGAKVEPLVARRLAEPFERLRDAADAHAAKAGQRPRVFLATLGEPADHSARALWARNFLAAGGIEATGGEALHSSVEVGAAFAKAGTPVACLCSSDKVYEELGESTAGVLKAAGAAQVLVAGLPKAQQKALEAAGVEGFLHAGCDAVAVLGALQGALGVHA